MTTTTMTPPRYDRGMTMKITVSLPDALVLRARTAVADGRAASVSAYVSEAIAQKEDSGSLKDLLDEWFEESGPPTEEEYAWADEQLRRAEEEWRQIESCGG
jgi:Arc/MetJ-type ribon-helix-helix transcriptional regulator